MFVLNCEIKKRVKISIEHTCGFCFQIIKERVYMGTSVREGLHWNSHPGALFVRSSASAATNFPFGRGRPDQLVGTDRPHFTAVIYTQSAPSSTTFYVSHNSPLFKLVANVAASQSVDKVRCPLTK